MSEMCCPCGGRAWSLAELQTLAREDGDEEEATYWESVLGPEDYYCAREDDVHSATGRSQRRSLVGS